MDRYNKQKGLTVYLYKSCNIKKKPTTLNQKRYKKK